jgi:hypothetical protein
VRGTGGESEIDQMINLPDSMVGLFGLNIVPGVPQGENIEDCRFVEKLADVRDLVYESELNGLKKNSAPWMRGHLGSIVPDSKLTK